jgi:probable rRNA maturation factor
MTYNVRVTVINETELVVAEELFSQVISRIVNRLRPVKAVDTVGVEIVLVGDQKIQTLNKQYLHNDYPTDVLSFPPSERSIEQAQTLGSIVISVDTAAKQSKQAGVAIEKELEVLTGHGLLHLLEFHHK